MNHQPRNTYSGMGSHVDAFAGRAWFFTGLVLLGGAWPLLLWWLNPESDIPAILDALYPVAVFGVLPALALGSIVALVLGPSVFILDQLILVGPKPCSKLWYAVNTKFEYSGIVKLALMGILAAPLFVFFVLPKEVLRHPLHVVSVGLKRLGGNKEATLEFGRKRYWYKQVRMMRDYAKNGPDAADQFLFQSSIGAHYGLSALDEMGVVTHKDWVSKGWKDALVREMTEKYGQPA